MSRLLFLLNIGMMFPQTFLSLNLKNLIADKISDAKCFAQCQEAATEEDRGQCFIIFKIIPEIAWLRSFWEDAKLLEDAMKTKFLSVA